MAAVLVISSGIGFRVSGFGFRVSGFGFRVSGLGFRVAGLEFSGVLIKRSRSPGRGHGPVTSSSLLLSSLELSDTQVYEP